MAGICIIIPFYNEEKRFEAEKFKCFYENHSNIFFCLVNDGSNDRTISILTDLQSQCDRITILNLQQNKGKAEAIRIGVNHMFSSQEFEFIAFLDADFSAPLESIPYMLFASPGKSIILGSRIMCLGTNVLRNPFRHYVGRVFATLASEMLNLPIYDTQCGAKIFSREIAKIAFNKPFVTTWLFDLELIMRIVNDFGWDYFSCNAKEVPLQEWIEKGGSKVKLSYMFRMPFDLLRVRCRYGKVKK